MDKAINGEVGMNRWVAFRDGNWLTADYTDSATAQYAASIEMRFRDARMAPGILRDLADQIEKQLSTPSVIVPDRPSLS